MDGPMTLVAIAGVIAVATILIRGVFAMASRDHDDAEEERLMFARVATQGVAIVLMLLVVYSAS